MIDPMLATGGSAVAALELLRSAGARHIRLVCIVAAPEGVKAVEQAYPDVPIYPPVVDELKAKYKRALMAPAVPTDDPRASRLDVVELQLNSGISATVRPGAKSAVQPRAKRESRQSRRSRGAGRVPVVTRRPVTTVRSRTFPSSTEMTFSIPANVTNVFEGTVTASSSPTIIKARTNNPGRNAP